MNLPPVYACQWSPLGNPALSFMNAFSESVHEAESKHRDLLPDLRRGSMMFIASDYSGQHDQARYESLAFLLADLEQCGEWEGRRKALRRKYLSDNRRVSYKNLNDKKRRSALVPFLAAANSIPGLVATILIDKRVGSLFSPTGHLEMDDLQLQEYAHWNRTSLEKLLRVIHFVSFFIAGLSRPHQNILWITDEDDIVPNEQRLREAVKLFSNVSGHYLKHEMGHFRWGTTKSDDGTRQLEDLVSVTDLVAGALSHMLASYEKDGVFPSSNLIIPPPRGMPRKSIEIMNWFADHTQPLKRLVYIIRPVEGSTFLSLKHLWFHGLVDFQG